MSNAEVPAPGPPPTTGKVRGMLADPSTLAATGLIGAVGFATVAGIIGFFADPASTGIRGRLLNLTDTVDVGDVALLGIAVALLLLTPDPPGGVDRPLLLEILSGLACVIVVYGVVRAGVILSEHGSAVLRVDNAIATIGVALAAATVAFYAAKQSFLKRHGAL